MNLILLFPKDFINTKTAQLSDHRHNHILKILKAKQDDELCIGLINSDIGTGKIINIDKNSTILHVKLSYPPPKKSLVTLILALPRPLVLKRTLLNISSMGVKKLILLNFNRVEKSFWNSSILKPNELKKNLILGLEQCKDTVMPEVIIKKRFKPFVEDELPHITKNHTKLIAHPEATTPCPKNINKKSTLIIGPEGGILPFELDLLARQGFTQIHFCKRILKVETIVPAILGRLSAI